MNLEQAITKKFNIAAAIGIIIILTTSCAYSYLTTKSNLEQRFTTQQNELITRLKINLPNALWDLRTDQIEHTLESELKSTFINELIIYEDKELTVLNSGKKRIHSGEIINSELPITEKNTDSILTVNLTFNDDFGDSHEVGILVIYINNSPLNQSINQSLHQLIIQTFILGAILILLLMLLSKIFILEPMKQETEK